MLLYQQIQAKFDTLQSSYETVLGVRFQSNDLMLSRYFSFPSLRDSFISSFIVDMKKTIHNNLKSACQERDHGSGIKSVQDVVTLQLRTLNDTYDIYTRLRANDADLQLEGMELGRVEEEIFPLHHVTRLSGLMYVDALLSFARKIEEELLSSTDSEWNLISNVGSVALSELAIREKWHRCVDYAMQVATLAFTMEAGEKSFWRDVGAVDSNLIIPEKDKCHRLLQHHCYDVIIGRALDHLSCGLFQYLYLLKSLPSDLKTALGTPLPNYLFDLINFVKKFLSDHKEDELWEHIATELEDRVLMKGLTYFFEVISSEIARLGADLDLKMIHQLSETCLAWFSSIKSYLLKQHQIVTDEAWTNLLSQHYPLSGFALHALSLIDEFITRESNQLPAIHKRLVQHFRESNLIGADMKTAILHYLQFCLHLRYRYQKNVNISELDAIVPRMDADLSVLISSQKSGSSSNTVNPILVVFGNIRRRSISGESGTPSNTYSLRTLSWTCLSVEELFTRFLLYPVSKSSEGAVSNSRRPSLTGRVSSKYSLLSSMHSIYARTEEEEISRRIKALKKSDTPIPLYVQSRMNQQRQTLATAAPAHTLYINEIQLMDMFYLVPSIPAIQKTFYLYVVIQIGNWIYATHRVQGGVFNENLLEDPIQISIYDPLNNELSPSSQMITNAVCSQYLSEDIVFYLMYSTSSAEDENAGINVANDRVVGISTLPLYHYHHVDLNGAAGKLILNTEDELVDNARNEAIKEQRKLPCINYSMQIL